MKCSPNNALNLDLSYLMFAVGSKRSSVHSSLESGFSQPALDRDLMPAFDLIAQHEFEKGEIIELLVACHRDAVR
jgi:hypothetical protein